jgi:hypothetical protein
MKIRLSCDVKDIEKFINSIQKKYHFNDEDFNELLKLYQQVQLVITPYAEYRINRYTTGVELIDRGTAAAVAMSLGTGFDRLQERYMREEKLSEAYMLDCIAAELMLIMYSEFNLSYARFHRRYVERYVFIGDAIPVTTMRDVLDFITCGVKKSTTIENKMGKAIDSSLSVEAGKQSGKNPDGEVVKQSDKKTSNDAVKQSNKNPSSEAVKQSNKNSGREAENAAEKKLAYRDNITANEYGVLTPSKSVVFYAILSENPSVRCRGICLGCGNADCENRYQEVRQLPERVQNDRTIKKDNKVVELNYGYQRIFGRNNLAELNKKDK